MTPLVASLNSSEREVQQEAVNVNQMLNIPWQSISAGA